MTRGRDADHLLEIPARGWWDIAWRVKRELEADHVGLMAAGVAFYSLLALFPGIAAAMAIAGLMTDASALAVQLEQIGSLLPEEAAEIIIGQARAVTGSASGGLGLAAVASILVGLFSASKGVQNLVQGLNVAYDEKEERGFVARTALILGLTTFMILGLLVGLGSTLIVPVVLAFVGFESWAETLVSLLRWPILAGLTILGLSVLYRWGPDRTPAQWRWVSPGAVMACLLWMMGSAGFAIYVRNFASYNETFGTLGGVVILLMWLWLSAYIVLLGAEINAEMEAQTRRDTTTGPEKKMGDRGAVKADRLGTIRT